MTFPKYEILITYLLSILRQSFVLYSSHTTSRQSFDRVVSPNWRIYFLLLPSSILSGIPLSSSTLLDSLWDSSFFFYPPRFSLGFLFLLLPSSILSGIPLSSSTLLDSLWDSSFFFYPPRFSLGFLFLLLPSSILSGIPLSSSTLLDSLWDSSFFFYPPRFSLGFLFLLLPSSILSGIPKYIKQSHSLYQKLFDKLTQTAFEKNFFSI